MAFENWPKPGDAPSMDDLSKCVHCGLCVNACPTYAVTGLEVESPRGRIHLAKAVGEGRISLTASVQSHWELCLQCRACEAVCPSGVPYGRIMESARAQLDAAPPARGRERWLRRQLLRRVVANPHTLRLAVAPVRWWATSPVRRLLRGAGVLRHMGRVGQMDAQLPANMGQPLRAGDAVTKPEVVVSRAVLFTGCVMGEVFGDVHRATARVLARSGVEAVADARQVCCGALSAHDGDLEFARSLARRNIDGLGATDDPIVVNSAGCGAALKEYGELLHGDSAYAERAAAFAARVRDVTEFLAELAPLPGGEFEGRVTYQDPCHLAHAQRITQQPRDLLGALKGCELVETDGRDRCCGAAGLYSVLQPGMSAALRGMKAEAFKAEQPDVVVTANPGCQMQYNAAVAEAGVKSRVMHVVEVIDEAQRRVGL